MPSNKGRSRRAGLDLTLLDDLLIRCARRLAKEMEEKPKLGDFIKMIELRRKIAPGDEEQQKFLKTLEDARQASLGDRKTRRSSSAPKGSANRGSGKGKSV